MTFSKNSQPFLTFQSFSQIGLPSLLSLYSTSIFLFLTYIWLFIFIYCCTWCDIVYIWWEEDNLNESVLSFHHVGFGHGSQVLLLGGKCLNLLSHLILPYSISFKTLFHIALHPILQSQQPESECAINLCLLECFIMLRVGRGCTSFGDHSVPGAVTSPRTGFQSVCSMESLGRFWEILSLRLQRFQFNCLGWDSVNGIFKRSPDNLKYAQS